MTDCIFFFYKYYCTTQNLKVTVARHQNSKKKKRSKNKNNMRENKEKDVNIIKHLRKLLEGFNGSHGN